MQPVALMSLLKHPLCRLGMAAGELRRGWRTLELAAFRAAYFGEGLPGVDAALERAQADMRAKKRRPQGVRRLGPDDWKAVRELLRRLGRALGPLEQLFAVLGQGEPADAGRGPHRRRRGPGQGRAAEAERAPLWGGRGRRGGLQVPGLAARRGRHAPDMRAADYPAFYRSLAEEVTVRLRAPTHPRIFIWEPYESRLQHPDVVILGSLNEATWPQAADPGPWLNRPMRQALGLPAPEERIGDAAHIFTSLLGVERVYLTRAAKIDGVPTVPSRWLLRLQALLAGVGDGHGVAPQSDRPWLAWARERNALAGPVRPVRAPEPRPALALRPRRLSATAIERWIANPYAVFAERILGLEALPALGRPLDAALRGQIVHDALGRFAQQFPDRLPPDVCATLVALARAGLEELAGAPRVAAFWTPRFDRFAEWFADTEQARRAGVRQTLAEVEGAIVLAGTAGPFTLTARADRFDIGEWRPRHHRLQDRQRQGAGRPGGAGARTAAAAGGGHRPRWRVHGDCGAGGHGPALHLRLRWRAAGPGIPLDADVSQLATQAREGLVRLIADFDIEATPYRAVRRSQFSYRYDAYAHLARVAEWSAETIEEG